MFSLGGSSGLYLALLLMVTGNASGLTIYNAGKNGDSTRGALLRFDTDVASQDPDVCFIAFGMNDSMNEVSPVLPEDYRANLLQLAESCEGNGIEPVFVTVNPVNKEKLYERHDPAYYEEQGGPNAIIEKYNQIIK